MDIADSIRYVIHCGLCDAHEEVHFVKKGSVRSGYCWEAVPETKFFAADWKNPNGGTAEPTPTNWKCKKCGAFDINIIGPTS